MLNIETIFPEIFKVLTLHQFFKDFQCKPFRDFLCVQISFNFRDKNMCFFNKRVRITPEINWLWYKIFSYGTYPLFLGYMLWLNRIWPRLLTMVQISMMTYICVCSSAFALHQFALFLSYSFEMSIVNHFFPLAIKE